MSFLRFAAGSTTKAGSDQLAGHSLLKSAILSNMAGDYQQFRAGGDQIRCRPASEIGLIEQADGAQRAQLQRSPLAQAGTPVLSLHKAAMLATLPPASQLRKQKPRGRKRCEGSSLGQRRRQAFSPR
jgi:hypothetical protein